MQDAFLAIDVGTQSVRAALLDGDGRVIAIAAEPMELVVPRAGWAEQNPNDWWAATVRNLRALIEAHGATHSIQAIGVCGHMHGTVPLGPDGRLLTQSVQLWCDKRAAGLADELAAQHDAATWIALAGNVPSAAWSGCKMAWMRQHQPELYAAAAHIITPKDYINVCLSGVVATDYSEASGSFLMDARSREWSPELAAMLGLDSSKLPPIASGAHLIGHVTPDAARATGLRAGTPLVAGAGDMLCQLLGTGMIAPGSACDVTGSSSIMCFSVARPVADARLMNLHGAGPGWVAFGILDSGGLSLNWWKNTWGQANYDQLTQEAAQIPPGCEGLLFLPYLNGERTLGSAASRGTFFGLHMRHQRAHMTRAIMEGVAFDLRQSLELVREQGFPVEAIVVGGGGARSPLWSQIKADIYNAPIATVLSAEPGLIGAMVLAAVGVGAFASEGAAVAHLVQSAGRFTPNERRAIAYTKLFGVFRNLHDTLQEPFKQAARVVAELDS